MNEKQALSQARKILGPKALIEIRRSVPVGEKRTAEIERRRTLDLKLKDLQAARDARRAEVLKADAEYQRLKQEAAATEKERDSLHGPWTRRVRVLLDKGWCHEVKSDGDNFEDAIAELVRKQGSTS